MPTYKGNVGNLMQHWTLCELLNIALEKGVPGLNFIDAHAMAPLARQQEPPIRADRRYNRVADRVQHPQGPNHQWASQYERAWHHLAPSVGYPNSAAFVEKIWSRKFSLSLCEVDWTTLGELGAWCDRVRNLDRCTNAQFFPGDWRASFDQLPLDPAKAKLPQESLTLVSFDPYVCSRSRRPNPPGANIYPEDVRLVLCALRKVTGPVIVQLSSYSANGDNRREQVIKRYHSIRGAKGFTLPAIVLVPNNGCRNEMMSLVYSHGVRGNWLAQLQALPDRFSDWARAIPARRAVADD